MTMQFTLATKQAPMQWTNYEPEVHMEGGHADYVWQRYRVELIIPEGMYYPSTEILRGICVVALRIDAIKDRPPASDLHLIDDGGVISHLCNMFQVDVRDNRVQISVRVGLSASDVLEFDACQVSHYQHDASLSNSVHGLIFNSSLPPYAGKYKPVSWRSLWKLLAARQEDVIISVSLKMPKVSKIPVDIKTLKLEPSSCPADIQILPNDDGPPIPCNKRLLSANSDVLKQGLNGSFEESSQGFIRMNFTTVAVNELLNYFHSQQLRPAASYSQMIAFDLLRASHYYNICNLWSSIVDMMIQMSYQRLDWFDIHCSLDTIEFLLLVNDEKPIDTLARNLVYVISRKHEELPDIQLEELVLSHAALRRSWAKYSMDVINVQNAYHRLRIKF